MFHSNNTHGEEVLPMVTSSSSSRSGNTYVRMDHQPTNMAFAATTTAKSNIPVSMAMDVTTAYDKAFLPPPPPMGDDHSVPVFENVVPPPQPKPPKVTSPTQPQQQQPAFMSQSSNSNQHNESTNMGYNMQQEPYPNSNVGPYVGQFKPSLFSNSTGPDLSNEKGFQYASLAGPQGSQYPTYQAQHQQHQLQFSPGIPGSMSQGLPMSADQLAYFAMKHNLQQNPFAYQQLQNAFNTNHMLYTDALSAQYLMASSQQPLHMRREQLATAYQQRNIIAQQHFSKYVPQSQEQIKPKPPPSKEWIQSIIGRDWEIYWRKQDSHIVKTRTKGKNSKKEIEEGGDDDEDEETWYDAKVMEVDAKGNNSGMVYFLVKFLGDEKRLFRMPLTPDIVRPSVRAWIRRTKAILMPSSQSELGNNIYKWERSLPHDTSIATSDAVAMKEIDDAIESSYPVTQNVTYHQNQEEGANQLFQQLREEHAVIINPLLKLIRHQTYLRKKLSPFDVDKIGDENGSHTASMSDENDDDDDSVLTEEYVDYLETALYNLEKACVWHYECWTLMKRLFAVHREYCKSPTKLISKDYLVHDLFRKGCDHLIQLSNQSNGILTQTGLAVNSNLDRKRAHVSDLDGGKDAKRSRLHEPGGAGTLHDIHDDFVENDCRLINLSYVNSMLEHVNVLDKRWYTECFRFMIYRVVDMILKPFLTWEKNARKLLCEEIQVSDRGVPSDESNRYYRDIRYEDIESSIDNANNDRLLKCFDFHAYVERLYTKLVEIDKFEVKALNLIESAIKEPDTHIAKEDPTLQGLIELKNEAMRKGSAVEGVNPIGHVTSRLTLQAIEKAIENRTWLLNMKRAESIRERDTFVKSLVENPSLPDPPSLVVGFYDRVESLAQRCSRQLAKAKKIEALLELRTAEKLDQEEMDFLTIQVAKKELKELQSQPYISLAEEKLAIRCDVLDWKMKAQLILSNQHPTFEDIQSLDHDLESIHNGTAAHHRYIQRGTLKCVEVDVKIQTFLKAECAEILEPLCAETSKLYSTALIWKNRADAILAVLDPSASLSIGTKSMTPSNKIELAYIGDVLAEHFGSKVDISDTFMKLKCIYDHGTNWEQSMQLKLEATDQSFEEIRRFLTQMEKCRPKGINVRPDEKIVASLLQLLRWYDTVNEYIANGSLDRDSLLEQLTIGLPLLELYCERKQSTYQFNILLDAVRLLLDERMRRANIQRIDVSTLSSDRVAKGSVDRLTDVSTDEQHGAPMLFLFVSLWAIAVGDFISRCGNMAFKGQTTLDNARKLWSARPVTSQDCPCLTMCQMFIGSLNVQELNDLISDAEEVEKDAHCIIYKVNNLHERGWTDSVQSISNKLKDIQENVTSRWKNNGQLTLTLSHQLEEELSIKNGVVCWLVRILPYPVLYNDNLSVTSDVGDRRIPSDVLFSLSKDIPKPHHFRKFSSIQKRIEILHKSASQWEKDIAHVLDGHTASTLTDKRRILDTREMFTKEDLDTIVSLSQRDFLSKVMMPREKEIYDLIDATRKFENNFHLFFTKEYCLECPDVEGIKECSLAAEDGTFYLELLTGNPFFDDLNVTIANLKKIADTMELNTVEKVTFKWIRSLYCWMNDIKSSVSADIPYCRHRTIGQDRADELISEGNQLLRQLPECFFQFLRLHNMHISTSFTEIGVSVTLAESNAVQSHGSMLVRWWIFLYNALKIDRSNLTDWNVKTKKLADDCERLRRSDESKWTKDPKALMPFYEYRDQAERLLGNLDDLFLTPKIESIELCSFVLTNCQKMIFARSSLAALQAFVKHKYIDDTAVIDNRLLLLDALAERTELARHTAPVSVEIQNNPNTICNPREQFRHALLAVLKNTLLGVKISVKNDDVLCERKANEIENELHDICGNDRSKYLEKAKSIKWGLKDTGNLQLALNVISGAMTADQLVNMSSEQLANPVTLEMMEQQKQKERQSHILTRPQETTLDSKLSSEQRPCTSVRNTNQGMSIASRQNPLLQQEKTTNFDPPSSDRGAKKPRSSAQDVDSQSISSSSDIMSRQGLASSAKSSVGNLMNCKVMAKEEAGARADTATVSHKSSMIKSRNGIDVGVAFAPPAPPSLNPLSEAASKQPAINNCSAETKTKPGPPPVYVRNFSDEYIFYLKVHSKKKEIRHKIRVQLECTGISAEDKALPELLHQCGLGSYDQINSFIKEKRDSGRRLELNFKVVPASDAATDELKAITEYIDTNKYVVVMDSKCRMDCCTATKDCRKCKDLPYPKSYLLTPKFQKQFGDMYHFTDPTSTYILTL